MKINTKILFCVFVAAYIWAVTEMYINDGKELYLSSLTMASVGMIWAVNNPNFSRAKVLRKIGNDISLYVYMFQSLIFWVSFKILYRIPIPAKDYLMPIIGAICTVIICFCFNEWIMIPLKKKVN